MSTEQTNPEGIGQEVRRNEDARMITGDALYTDDLPATEAAHIAILRSPYAHAKIVDVDTSTAEAMDGVVAVFTAADLASGSAPTPGNVPSFPGAGIGEPPDHLNRRILAGEKVRYEGDAVAAVVAEEKYLAHDAREAIDVEYERLDAVVDPHDATAEDAPVIHEETPDNVAFEATQGDPAAVEQAIEDAPHTFDLTIGNQRVVQNPVEPRGALVEYSPRTGDLQAYVTTQVPHKLRRDLSKVLDYPASKIRVVVPDMGGGFGCRCAIYPETVLACWCAMELERTVKWRSTRTENYATEAQGRGFETDATLAFDDDANVLALRMGVLDDIGAYHSTFASVIGTVGTNVLTGCYDIPVSSYEVTAVLTNLVPSDAYRGVCETELIHSLERLMDIAAAEFDLDPAEIRRRNFVQPEQFPYDTAAGSTYDSGDYEATMDVALERLGYEDVRERQAELREEGRYLGVGLSTWIEKSGVGCGAEVPAWEYSNIQVHPSGEATVFCGASNHGQGHETTFAQVVSDQLDIPFEDVTVIENDTNQVREGVGTYASRCAPTTSASLDESADKLIEKGRKIAAFHLEADVADVEYTDGEFHVAGAPDRALSLQEVAAHANIGTPNVPEDVDPGFEATSYYDPDDYTFPFGTHVAVVEVDPDTGEVSFERYVGIDDCGTQINPKIVEGQIHGGVAQGIGQALYEGAVFDESGTQLTGSHMDYTLPRAHLLPEMEVGYTVTPSPRNPLGVKGVGESGAIAALPAIVNAVEDALAPFDVEPMTPPLTNEKIWQAVEDARSE